MEEQRRQDGSPEIKSQPNSHGSRLRCLSPYRALSLSGHRIWARIQIEHAHHGGKENGKLPVTYRDFNEFGVCWDAIGPGIREVEALGFIRVTEEGRAGNGEWRKPNKFALTHTDGR